MESHKGKYEITQNPEDLNDTSLCIYFEGGTIYWLYNKVW